MKTRRGFTLIELLVVIAIIGILAAIILANLSKARFKGNDAAVRTNMANISAEAEVYFDQSHTDQNGNSYTEAYGSNTSPVTICNNPNTFFSQDGTAVSAIDQIKKNAASGPDCAVSAHGQSWAMSATFKGETDGNGNPKSWCVDSGRYADYGTIVPGGSKCMQFVANPNPQ